MEWVAIAHPKQKLRILVRLDSDELVFLLLDLVFRYSFCFGKAIIKHWIVQVLYMKIHISILNTNLSETANTTIVN